MKDTPAPKKGGENRTRAIFSAIPTDDTLVEIVLRPDLHRTFLCVYRSGEVQYEKLIEDKGTLLMPYSAKNNLLRLGVNPG